MKLVILLMGNGFYEYRSIEFKLKRCSIGGTATKDETRLSLALLTLLIGSKIPSVELLYD